MSSESALAFASLGTTFLIQSTGAYLLLWVLCRLIRNSHLRFRLWGLFLTGLVAAWLGLLLLTSLSAPLRSNSTSPPFVSHPYWSWWLNSALVPPLRTVLSNAAWVYVTIIALLVLSFCNRFWQLRTFLRASQPAPEALSFLFELVRSDAKAPRCELRFVTGLRSPAATGWWRPKVLLPNELLPRLEAQQLVDILRHELMHVRRRDYLWDRLATLGCYLVFFHAAVWLARRRLRWERELVCDDGVVERSGEQRLEYASSLTTLASWWFLEEEIAGPVDLLSSSPSLLTARVRALLAWQTAPYSSYKKAVVGLLATAALTLGVWLVPEVVFTPSLSIPRKAAKIQGIARSSQTVARIDRKQMLKRHKIFASVAASPAFDLRSAPPNLEFPINVPVLSRSQVDQSPDSIASRSPIGSSSTGELNRESRSTGSVWDESPPHTTRPTAGSKIGARAMRVVRFGIAIAILGSRMGGHEHEKEP
jgi:beta-lactamase regulating signal transducer with metallopeptidase domain